MIRNDPIGLQHILSLIIYTDLSSFCTKYRQTYRKLDGETTTKEVEVDTVVMNQAKEVVPDENTVSVKSFKE